MSPMEKLIAEIRANKDHRAALETKYQELNQQMQELSEELNQAAGRHRVLRETLDDHLYNGTEIIVAKMRAHETIDAQGYVTCDKISSGSITSSKISAGSITASKISTNTATVNGVLAARLNGASLGELFK